MTESVSIPVVTSPRTRRSLLAGALGGLGAWLVSASARVAPTEAAAGNNLVIGSETNDAGSANTQLVTNSNVVAFKLLQNGPGTALMGYATPTTGATRGVYGRTDSADGYGVQARNASLSEGTGAAIQAIGVDNTGLEATSDNGNKAAVHANHTGSGGNAVFAESALGIGVYATGNSRGVVGISSSGHGVRGESTSGSGIYGYSTVGYSGAFENRVRIGQYLDMPEVVAPATPPPNTARIFVRDNGGTKTELCVVFPSGTVQVIKTDV
jgi:hypothetical protein